VDRADRGKTGPADRNQRASDRRAVRKWKTSAAIKHSPGDCRKREKASHALFPNRTKTREPPNRRTVRTVAASLGQEAGLEQVGVELPHAPFVFDRNTPRQSWAT